MTGRIDHITADHGLRCAWSKRVLSPQFQVSFTEPARSRGACQLTGPSSDEYLTALKRDRQSWLLEEPGLRPPGPGPGPDLVVMLHDMSMQGLYRLPAQGWDRRCENAAVRRLRGASAGPAPRGRRASRQRSAPNQLVLAERVATELTGLRDGIIQGVCLPYDGLPVHSLGEGALFTATCAHLARPCIAGAHELLGRLAEAAGVNTTTLQRPELALMQRLDWLAASVQDEVVASCDYWEELRAALAEQRASRPTRVRVVRRSQCLHRVSRKLLAQAWQTRTCDPSTGPASAGMLRGVVSRARRDWFSELANITVAHAPGSATALRPVAAESRMDFDNNAG